MCNLYEGQYDDNLSTDYDYEDVLSKLQQLDKRIHKLKKKKKGAKHGKKRKMKERMKALELEYEQLKQFTLFLACQYKAQPNQQIWWQSAICSTLPKALELATATINRLPSKAPPLYITDGSDRK